MDFSVTIFIVILSVAVGLLISINLLYRCCFAPYQTLKKCGIIGPIPVPLVGNLLVFKMHLAEISKHLYNKYKGSVVGIYFGMRLTVYVKDPDMIKQITVTEFDNFIDRPCKVRIMPDEYKVSGLTSTTGEVWRSTRCILTPAFSSSKLKKMVPIIQKSIVILVEKIGEVANSGQSINILEFYHTFTQESIMAVAFGRRIDVQRENQNELANAALKAAEMKRDRVMVACIHLLKAVPCLEGLIQPLFRRKYSCYYRIMQQIAKKLMEARKDEHQRSRPYKDILQLMIEASDDKGMEVEAAVATDCPAHKSNNRSKTFLLSSREIVDNLIMLLFDETSNSTLAHVSYLLAVNPDIQTRLQSEIDDYFGKDTEATLYEAAQNIHYLDCVIQESLRLYPPAVTISRLCVKSTSINGIHIPKGTEVHIPIKQLHYDPKYWEDPEKFNPDRFLPEEKAKRHKFVHLPFGAGPRNCIGMKYALLEAKIVCIELLKKFSFVQAPDTKVPLPVPEGFSSTPTEGIFVKVILRS